jgi:hypothetical protein
MVPTPLAQSCDVGVGHVETIFTTPGNDTVIFVPFSRLPVALAVPIPWPPSPSALVGVGHVAVNCSNLPLYLSALFKIVSASSAIALDDRGVGHVAGDPV